MSDKESAQSVIESYHRRQQKSQKLPTIIMIIAAVLLVVGAAALIFWLLGPDELPFAPKPTFTPTQTATQTLTPSATATTAPTDTPTSPPTDTPTPSQTTTPSGPFEYTVEEGDTLSSIAEKFTTDVLTILALNPNIDSQTLVIRVGDKILIPAPDTQLPTATPLPEGLAPGTLINYTIVAGDTLEALALRFNSTVDAIVKQNNLENANDIQVALIIVIPVNLVTPIPTATEGTVFPTAALPPTVTATP